MLKQIAFQNKITINEKNLLDIFYKNGYFKEIITSCNILSGGTKIKFTYKDFISPNILEIKLNQFNIRGLFAKQEIPAKKIIGLYTGDLTYLEEGLDSTLTIDVKKEQSKLKKKRKREIYYDQYDLEMQYGCDIIEKGNPSKRQRSSSPQDETKKLYYIDGFSPKFKTHSVGQLNSDKSLKYAAFGHKHYWNQPGILSFINTDIRPSPKFNVKFLPVEIPIDSSMKIKKINLIYSTSKIPANSELFLDYGPDYISALRSAINKKKKKQLDIHQHSTREYNAYQNFLNKKPNPYKLIYPKELVCTSKQKKLLFIEQQKSNIIFLNQKLNCYIDNLTTWLDIIDQPSEIQKTTLSNLISEIKTDTKLFFMSCYQIDPIQYLQKVCSNESLNSDNGKILLYAFLQIPKFEHTITAMIVKSDLFREYITTKINANKEDYLDLVALCKDPNQIDTNRILSQTTSMDVIMTGLRNKFTQPQLSYSQHEKIKKLITTKLKSTLSDNSDYDTIKNKLKRIPISLNKKDRTDTIHELNNIIQNIDSTNNIETCLNNLNNELIRHSKNFILHFLIEDSVELEKNLSLISKLLPSHHLSHHYKMVNQILSLLNYQTKDLSDIEFEKSALHVINKCLKCNNKTITTDAINKLYQLKSQNKVSITNNYSLLVILANNISKYEKNHPLLQKIFWLISTIDPINEEDSKYMQLKLTESTLSNLIFLYLKETNTTIKTLLFNLLSEQQNLAQSKYASIIFNEKLTKICQQTITSQSLITIQKLLSEKKVDHQHLTTKKQILTLSSNNIANLIRKEHNSETKKQIILAYLKITFQLLDNKILSSLNHLLDPNRIEDQQLLVPLYLNSFNDLTNTQQSKIIKLFDQLNLFKNSNDSLTVDQVTSLISLLDKVEDSLKNNLIQYLHNQPNTFKSPQAGLYVNQYLLTVNNPDINTIYFINNHINRANINFDIIFNKFPKQQSILTLIVSLSSKNLQQNLFKIILNIIDKLLEHNASFKVEEILDINSLRALVKQFQTFSHLNQYIKDY
ncbi:hypothetical protein DID75_04415 [Candidatus Marinamargulisbacteria bacterium SCGC AG-410-N11]|nr:hypothetical protein DID75_04415 [Candidatus Marinamargulisbacteria bacterium SCGC AG-410-N11]